MTIPIFTIGYQLFLGPGESWSHILKYLLWEYTYNTLIICMGCVILTSVFGISAAWIVSRYLLFKNNFLEWMLILPLSIPSYIVAYTYAGIVDYGGPLELLIRGLGLPFYKVDLMNMYGLIFILSISLFPYVYVSARAVFIYQSYRLMEASKLLGASNLKTFFRIILPLARPAIVGALLLVIMEVLNDYGAAKYYGVSTFTTGIFRSWFSLGEPATAVYLSAILLGIVFLLIVLENKQRGNRQYSVPTQSSLKLPLKKLNRPTTIIAIGIASLPVLLGFIIPFLQLLYWAYLSFHTVITSSFVSMALQSLGLASLASIATVFCAVLLLYVPKWNRLYFLKNSARLAILGYAVPGAVIAVGVLIPVIALDRWFIEVFATLFSKKIGLLFSNSIALLVYAYVIRFTAVAFNPLAVSKEKINNNLTESSRLLGKGLLHSFFKIDLPLLKTGIASAAILVFVDSMKELPLTLILKPYQLNTLAVKAYEYASDELIIEASIPSLLIIATGLVPIMLLNKYVLK